MQTPITVDGILNELQLVDSLVARGYMSNEQYDKYKKEAAVRLLRAYNKIDLRPWWRMIAWPGDPTN
jgi:hypothetical protein